MKNSLQDITVLDLSRVLAGPWCTQNLADLGADVIKVERPGPGDDTRSWGPPYLEGTTPEDGYSAYYIAANRNKKSITVNFRSEEGKDVIKRLAKDADVVVENYKTGSLARLGLDYDDLREINPELIWVSITGYGPTGPKAENPGYDYVFQGMSGFMSYTGRAQGEEGAGPIRAGVAIIDLMTGMYATTAILAALHERERTGKGQRIDVTLADVSVALNANQASNYLVGGVPPAQTGTSHPNVAPYDVFEVADGHMILGVGNDEQYRRLTELPDFELLRGDDRFQFNRDRIRLIGDLRPIVAQIMKQKTMDYWTHVLDEAGVPFGPINTMDKVFEDPQVKHRGIKIEADGHYGSVPMVRSPLVEDSADATAPPALGEHTDEVLAQFGFTAEQIAKMHDSGTV
ncbi:MULTISPECIES: CaiB/BaiF CoA transferase family protein [unclassified Brevibacterium]|uniref:CaiB/BaiF CoA transferase family protein n=1 Tax=unclassified Brevibacterium TaxID=2614124 RepID=UPI0008A1FE0C|nr:MULTISPECIES: CaiB/BaiF CoA-transferase family protein [unclassified Brevibacterium]OFL67579.1 CoA-transferase [Brevibacterium sp. HMSC063G07]OFS27863.1 CoA-transferase [Brevibacterium sp. HMSC07C04]